LGVAINSSDINQKQIEEIMRVDPTGELCQKLLTIFEAEIPQLLQTLSKSIEENKLFTAAQIVHSIRSSSLNIGAQKLADQCLSLEKDFTENKTHSEDVMIVLQQNFDYTVSMLKDCIQKAKG
jgi:HPt (histidine-containing phosphotransfer) domain-containing protein